MTEELKDCPFCGNTQPRITVDAGRFSITCGICHSRGGWVYATKKEAAAAWNTRHDDNNELVAALLDLHNKYVESVPFYLATDRGKHVEQLLSEVGAL